MSLDGAGEDAELCGSKVGIHCQYKPGGPLSAKRASRSEPGPAFDLGERIASQPGPQRTNAA
jgi:hypothetical protein